MAGRLRRLGLRLRPLFSPSFDQEQRRLRAIEDGLAAQREELARGRAVADALVAQVRALEERLSRTTRQTETAVERQRKDLERWRDESVQAQREGLKAVDGGLRAVRTALSRQGSFTSDLMKRARRIPETAVREQQVLERLTRIAHGTRPILVGPWTGEVGFELIYWVPFVRWFVRSFGVDPARLVIVSRGGPRSWYAGLGAHYEELFDLVQPGTFQSATAENLKQRRISPFEVDVIRRIVRARGNGPYSILHPRYMFALFRAFFGREAGIRHVFAHTVHEQVTSPGRALVPGLPPEYIAVKFYFRPSFPETTENRAFIAKVLAGLAAHTPVVLLNPGFRVDDHHDYGDRRYYELTSLGVDVTPQNNLEIQTAVVKGAKAFVGTYGGFSYLGPLCGVPSIAFYGDHQFYLHHRYMADAVFASVGGPALAMLPVDASDIQRRAVLDLVNTPKTAR